MILGSMANFVMAGFCFLFIKQAKNYLATNWDAIVAAVSEDLPHSSKDDPLLTVLTLMSPCFLSCLPLCFIYLILLFDRNHQQHARRCPLHTNSP
jgi:TRAP-type C4-dicarboxylate transport system permease small subunit